MRCCWPRFAGSLDYESTAKDLQAMVRTNKTELLFLALFLRLLKPGGHAVVIAMPSGVFKPYAGLSTAILIFTKTNSGGTDDVWFYDMQADGLSLDDKRTPLTAKNGENSHDVHNLPDILARWQNLDAEAERPRTDQSFLMPKAEIAENSYDLSINRYKEIVYEEVEYDPPDKILGELRALDKEIGRSLDELEAMLGVD